MGLDSFNENTLRDYVYAVLGQIDSPPEMNKQVQAIVHEVSLCKKENRRETDVVTHEKIVGYLLLKFWEYGRHQGIINTIRSLKDSMEKVKAK